MISKAGMRTKSADARRKARLGYILLSNAANPAPSTRIAALNMFPYLRAADLEPVIAFQPSEARETPELSGLFPSLVEAKLDMVVFQKVHGQSAVSLARRLAGVGIRCVYSVCDFVDPEMADATDMTIVVTDYLKSLYPARLHSKIRVVHDGIENAHIFKQEWRNDRGSGARPLKAVLVTAQCLDELPVLRSPPAWLQVTIVGRYARRRLSRAQEVYWQLMGKPTARTRARYIGFLANPRIKAVPWDPHGVYEVMRHADIGIIPIHTTPIADERIPPSWKVRSENRLTMKMAMGLPVVATPIPAYEPAIIHGENGYLARSENDWWRSLEELRNPELRFSMGTRARESVLQRYSQIQQAQRLIQAFSDLLADTTNLLRSAS